jgi:GNAT superfamily N-acetyltransferase
MHQLEDHDFDLSVYASTRLDELTVLGWTSNQVDEFVRMQYQAQSRHYRQHYPHATFSIVTVAGKGAGRLIVARSERDILIVDIALLPKYRRGGIGGRVVRQLIAEADQVGIPVRCHVEVSNPARGFWEHLGFTATRLDGAHVLMERQSRPRLAEAAGPQQTTLALPLDRSTPPKSFATADGATIGTKSLCSLDPADAARQSVPEHADLRDTR